MNSKMKLILFKCRNHAIKKTLNKYSKLNNTVRLNMIQYIQYEQGTKQSILTLSTRQCYLCYCYKSSQGLGAKRTRSETI